MKYKINSFEDEVILKFGAAFPTNPITFLERIKEIIKHEGYKAMTSDKVKRNLFILNVLAYGTFFKIDVSEEYSRLVNEFEKSNKLKKENKMEDVTEDFRKVKVIEINLNAKVRKELEEQYGEVYDTDEVSQKFEIISFLAFIFNALIKFNRIFHHFIQ